MMAIFCEENTPKEIFENPQNQRLKRILIKSAVGVDKGLYRLMQQKEFLLKLNNGRYNR